MPQPIIKVEHLSKQYKIGVDRTYKTLQDSITSAVKSPLSRITEPTEGKITMHGRVASLLEVGTGFHPELTGRENIYLNGSILGMKKREIDAKFDQIRKKPQRHADQRTINTFGNYYLNGAGVRPQTPVRRRQWRGFT